jgi:DNA invertase Pin-like site-specific DNA recombinase
VLNKETRSSRTAPSSNEPLRAAQYVRMSTEHQKYSTENQGEVILKYAELRGITIVRTYADHGKSGLRLDGRDALKRLIGDVRRGDTDFNTILVYDVSRWGRFQDADESAYYEFICKEAGINVQYCAEQFENDGSLSATIIKNMKRAMAGEYSRELSAKVFIGQCRLIGLGFRQGGMAGYGLRRQLIDEHRQPKGELPIGAHKSLQTDRVILVPGPPTEVETVRRMYRMFLDDGQTEREIASILNAEECRTDLGRPWTRGTVHQVLTNDKYAGHNVYNRVSFKLKKKRVVNPPDMWVRADGAFTPVVEPALFERVRAIVHERCRRLSNEEMLTRLEALRRTAGGLSGLIIDEQDEMPSSSSYRTRFGSLLRAYTLIGYSTGRDYDYLEINRVLRAMHPEVIAASTTAIAALGGTLRQHADSDLFTVNDEFTLSIVICRSFRTPSGALRWKIRLDSGLYPDITVALRMDAANQDVLDCYLLPRLELPKASALRVGDDNGFALDSYRFETLDALFDLAARSQIRSVA